MEKLAKQPGASTNTPSNPMVSTEVNAIQSMQSSSNKKKGKGENKKPGNQQENPKPTAPDNDNKGKRKAKYPWLLCGGDHFTKEFPRHDEINKFLKSNLTPTVLTGPFLSQQQLIDHMSNQGNSIPSLIGRYPLAFRTPEPHSSMLCPMHFMTLKKHGDIP